MITEKSLDHLESLLVRQGIFTGTKSYLPPSNKPTASARYPIGWLACKGSWMRLGELPGAEVDLWEVQRFRLR
jgi:hypothetical protein